MLGLKQLFHRLEEGIPDSHSNVGRFIFPVESAQKIQESLLALECELAGSFLSLDLLDGLFEV